MNTATSVLHAFFAGLPGVWQVPAWYTPVSNKLEVLKARVFGAGDWRDRYHDDLTRNIRGYDTVLVCLTLFSHTLLCFIMQPSSMCLSCSSLSATLCQGVVRIAFCSSPQVQQHFFWIHHVYPQLLRPRELQGHRPYAQHAVLPTVVSERVNSKGENVLEAL